MTSLEIRSSDNPLAFLWTLSVLLYWQTYCYIHRKQNLFRNCYGNPLQKTNRVIQPFINISMMSYQSTIIIFTNMSTWHILMNSKLRTECKTNTIPILMALTVDILLNIDSNCSLTTTIYDKRDDFDFATANFPCCSM
jgi:hypothetical protein